MSFKYLILYIRIIIVFDKCIEIESSKDMIMTGSFNNLLSSDNDYLKEFQKLTLFFANTNNVLFYDETMYSCEKLLFDIFRESSSFQSYFIFNTSILLTSFENLKSTEYIIAIVGNSQFINRTMLLAIHMDTASNQQGLLTFTYKWVIITNDIECDLLLNMFQSFYHIVCIESNIFYSPTKCNFQENDFRQVKTTVKTLQCSERGYHWNDIDVNSGAIDMETLFPSVKNKLNKRSFTIGSQVFHTAHFNYIFAKTETSFTGIYYDVIQEIAKYLNMSFTIQIPEDGHWGHIDANGSWTGLVGLLYRKEVDFVIAPLTVSHIRRRVIDFADYPLEITYVSGIYRQPNNTIESIQMIFRPFSTPVWIGFVICIIVYSFIISLLEFWFEMKKDTKNIACFRFVTSSYPNNIYLSFCSLVQQPIFHRSVTKVHMQVLWSSWLLFCIILLCIWASNIISHLTVQNSKVSFRTINDLLHQNMYKYGTRQNSMAGLYFASSNIPIIKDLWQNMKRFDETDDTVLSQLSVHDYMTKVKTENFVNFDDSTAIHYAMAKDCTLDELRERLFTAPYAIGLQQNSAFKPLVNDASRWIVESGVMNRIKAKYMPKAKCDVNSGKIPLSLTHTVGVFRFMAVACITSVVLYLLEKIVHTLRVSKFN